MNNQLKENVDHGDFILPFTIYQGEIAENIFHVPLHWHEQIEITYIEKGLTELNVDLISHVAEEGSIFIIKPLSLHSMKSFPSTYLKWNTIVFNLNMLNSALTDGCLIKYIAPILNNEHELPLTLDANSKGYNEILSVLKDIFECYASRLEAYELELKSLLFHFFALLYKFDLVVKNTKAKILPEDVTNKIRFIINYIDNNYKEPLSIANLSELCGFSEYHFMKFFKKYIGMTCIEYINNYRLEEASNLLNNTDKSIMDISLEVGFNSVSYFNKLFKMKYNLTPKEFRTIEQ